MLSTQLFSRGCFQALFHDLAVIAVAIIVSHLLSLSKGTIYPAQSSFHPPV
jgi:hypothetical protein